MVWHVIELALDVTAPSQLWRGLPVWRLLAAELALPLTCGAAYLLLALFPAMTRATASRLAALAIGIAGVQFARWNSDPP